MKSRQNWSDRDTVKLHKLLKEQPYLWVNEICIILGRSKITIQNKLRKFGYKRGWMR